MWYPSSGFHERQGIIVGAYVWTAEIGEVFAASTPARRLEAALVSGERVHPGYRDEVADGVSVAWSKIPFNRGAWAEWTRDGPADLRAPAGAGRPILFCRRAHELDPRLAGRRRPLRPQSNRRNRQKGEEVARKLRLHGECTHGSSVAPTRGSGTLS